MRDSPRSTGIVLALVALVLLSIGFLRSAGRGGVAIAEATVEVLDTVLRVAGNAVSFARLAAFGLVHAAIGAAVLAGASVLWGGGPAGMLAAAVLFAAERRGVLARGAGSHGPGAAPGVLRALLPGVRGRGPPILPLEAPRERRSTAEADMIATLLIAAPVIALVAAWVQRSLRRSPQHRPAAPGRRERTRRRQWRCS